MADVDIDWSKLPEDVREKLAELDLELSEGRKFLSIVATWPPYIIDNLVPNMISRLYILIIINI